MWDIKLWGVEPLSFGQFRYLFDIAGRYGGLGSCKSLKITKNSE
jgi:hypothetical protein